MKTLLRLHVHYFILVFCLFAFTKTFSQSDIIISQYIETNSGSTPKGIEIFNVSGSNITFTGANNLQVYQGTNGGACGAIINITSGTLSANEVWVIGTADLITFASTNGTNLSGATTYAFAFNGDDALQIRLGGIIQDQFGICGSDPGSAWTAGGVTTANNNLQIKNAICDGDTDGWTDPSIRFDQIANGSTMTGFGNAPASCSAAPPTITSFTPANACPGTPITITGTNLTNATVTIGGIGVTKTANTATSITVTSGTSSGVIQVTTASGAVNSATNFTANAVPATPTNSFSAAPSYTSCDPVTLSYTGTAPVNTVYYWQTAANNESTANPVSTPQTVSVTGYRWVRARNTSGCWSAAVQSPQVVIQTSAIITTQPQDISVSAGSNATFTVVTSNGTNFQWQQRIGAGVWTDIGTNSNSVTITNVPLSYDGYQYRVIVSNDCGSVISNTAILTVSDTCAEENFSNITSSTTSYNSETWNGTDGVTWNATGVRTDQTLTGKAICFGTSGTRHVTSPSYAGGMGVLKFNYVRGFTGTGTRTLQVWVNGVQQGGNITVSATSNVVVQHQQAINIAGNVQLQIRSTGSQIIIDDIEWSCYDPCTPAVISSSPTSGPEETIVTITGTNFFAGSTVSFNGTPASSVTYINATTLEAVVPNGATTGNLRVDTTLDCDSELPFTLIDENSSNCEGTSNYTSDLIIYEIYDENPGNGGMITIFNGTNTTRNLANYLISRTTDYTDLGAEPYVVDWHEPTGMLAPGQLYRLKITSSVCSDAYYQSPYSTIFGTGFNARDGVQLRQSNGVTVIDELYTPNYAGYYMKRKIDFMQPNTTHNNADWDIVTLSSAECRIVGVAPVLDVNSTPPTVSTPILSISDCDLSATLSVTGTEGFNGGGDTQELAYQWYYSAPGDLGWTAVPDNAIYDGVNTDTLDILNTLTLNGYQYYCQVREDDATCYTASNALKLTLSLKIWNGLTSNDWTLDANWTPAGLPTVNDVVAIPSGNPIIIGSAPFPPTDPVYAKSLIVLNGATLEIPIGKNLIVENCIVNNGTIDLKNAANLVQVNETNENSGNGNFFMERSVSDVASLNYIYWSSPIAGFNMAGIPGSNTHRYYWSPTATNANGSDGDWIQTSGVMARGIGYIIRVSGATPNLDVTLGGNGLGTPHNGLFTTPISKGSHVYADPADDVNNYYNLIGNPYPSAISADAFIAVNAAQLMDDDPNPSVLGTVYLWRHQATPNETIDNPFYEDFAINYDGSNYVAYNATGATPANGFDGNIASGQAFFVLMDETTTNTNVTFTNAMRYGDPITDAFDNGQFLRTVSSEQSANTMERHRIWLDLIAPNNTSVSTLVGYVTGATNDKDRLFDGYETNATGLGFYSMVGYDRMGIQGRALPFVDTDTVPLGVNIIQTGTHTIAINQVDGLFEAGQDIFLEDTYTNTIHNMRAAPYTFYSVGGKFNDRFILRYLNATLSIPDTNMNAGLTVVELSNGHVKFTVGHNLTIQSVEIYDMLGRQLYHLPGSSATEIYNLSNLSQAAYVAKVTLSNGQTVTKRALKQQ